MFKIYLDSCDCTEVYWIVHKCGETVIDFGYKQVLAGDLSTLIDTLEFRLIDVIDN